jgi:hypothetical protein
VTARKVYACGETLPEVAWQIAADEAVGYEGWGTADLLASVRDAAELVGTDLIDGMPAGDRAAYLAALALELAARLRPARDGDAPARAFAKRVP